MEGIYWCGLICDSIPMTTFSFRLQSSCYYVFKNADIGIFLHISLKKYDAMLNIPPHPSPHKHSYLFLIFWRTCTKEGTIIIVQTYFSAMIKCFVLLLKPEYVLYGHYSAKGYYEIIF